MTEQANSSLLPLNPMHLPDAPSWFPLAWGWWAIAGTLVLAVLLFWMLMRRKKKHLAPKKTALRLLAANQHPSSAIELVRQAALCYFPREEIAKLTGKEWHAFLDSYLNTPLFEPNQEQWQRALYTKEPVASADMLVQHCAQWVNEALPPKKRRA
ncbi:DUF4381 domain-containing protein [Vibrio sp. V39_P1S14PM300]|uniref:DUF4381 domain-containing protein n=1 Tax=Vibrio sp. V39_P1S14PM300 TaxID=1938690 RepID=UPI00137326BA|nr:DUF4381 domain-containing protein [Vibrio sp. V39_P1S14PM300]NAX19578.1 DUF4381 family protein [Vibrio sp. V39_P1S14PM300]